MERVPLKDDEYRWFSEWLVEEFGIRYGPEKRDILRSRLEPRRAALGLETFEQLYFHLKYHPERQEERERLIPHLTNNESYFFRETAQLELLREEILPDLARRSREMRDRKVRILSAGCASGEEAYTIAIVVRESGVAVDVEITGVDLDHAALDRARRGIYTANAFRRCDPATQARYFAPADSDGWTIRKDIASMVHFLPGNLAAPDWGRDLPPQDVIFCRNVLIYFAEPAARQVVDRFYRTLSPGGALFLGHAESLSRVPTRFVACRRPGAVFYRRPEGDRG
jgi:chemotaxis protein methyltransferase CheR